jgi:hypothetical protein
MLAATDSADFTWDTLKTMWLGCERIIEENA